MKMQRGGAIVMAMGIVACAAVAASAILATQASWSRQSELAGDKAQAQALLQAGADWARAVLYEDQRAGSADHRGEPWALRLPAIAIENGEVEGRLEDQQGAFNLNNLVRDGEPSAAHVAQFQRLLSVLKLPAGLADALVDWLDADGEARPQGAEDAYYLGLRQPYLAANRPLIDLADLARVRGYDAEVRERLRPFVTALPRRTPVNVNTAPPEVLAAVVDNLDLDRARLLVAARERAYFRDRSDFLRRLPEGAVAPSSDIAAGSEFFMATLRVRIGDARAYGRALIARPDARWPVVVWQRLL